MEYKSVGISTVFILSLMLSPIAMGAPILSHLTPSPQSATSEFKSSDDLARASTQPFKGVTSQPISASLQGGVKAEIPAGSTVSAQAVPGPIAISQADSVTSRDGSVASDVNDATITPDGSVNFGSADKVTTASFEGVGGKNGRVSSDGSVQGDFSSITSRRSVSSPGTIRAEGVRGLKDSPQSLSADAFDRLSLSSSDASGADGVGSPRSSSLDLTGGEGVSVDDKGVFSAQASDSFHLSLQGGSALRSGPLYLTITGGRNIRARIPGFSSPVPLSQRQPVSQEDVWKRNRNVNTLLKLSNIDLSVGTADQFTLNGYRLDRSGRVNADVTNRLMYVSSAKKLEINQVTLSDVAGVVFLSTNPPEVFFPNDSGVKLDVMGRPVLLHTTAEDNVLGIKPATNGVQEIKISGATLGVPRSDGKSTDVFVAGNETIITFSKMEDGVPATLLCAAFNPVSAYGYKTTKLQSIFSIAVLRAPHKVCLITTPGQSFPPCQECTVVNTLKHSIESRGTAEYRRYHYQVDGGQARLLGFTPEPRILPNQSNNFHLQLGENMDNVFRLTFTPLASQSSGVQPPGETLIINNFLTITDPPGVIERLVTIQPQLSAEQTSDPLFDSIVSNLHPEAILDGSSDVARAAGLKNEWAQLGANGRKQVRVLFPGNPLIDQSFTQRQMSLALEESP